MSSIAFFHAHPDDEGSQTAGTMALAVADGHRTVCIYATGGEHGDIPADLAPGETLAQRRRGEAETSARILGTSAVHWLGYTDSGMTGWAQNEAENAFARADLEVAATRLAELLAAEQVDILVSYDWHGGYGHPDHIQAHRVARRAAQLLADRNHEVRQLDVTMNRDAMRTMFELAVQAGMDPDWDPDAPANDGNPIGTPEAEIAWAVDVTSVLATKRAALGAHASQASDVGMMLALPEEVFALAFGTEYYIDPDAPLGMASAPFWADSSAGT